MDWEKNRGLDEFNDDDLEKIFNSLATNPDSVLVNNLVDKIEPAAVKPNPTLNPVAISKGSTSSEHHIDDVLSRYNFIAITESSRGYITVTVGPEPLMIEKVLTLNAPRGRQSDIYIRQIQLYFYIENKLLTGLLQIDIRKTGTEKWSSLTSTPVNWTFRDDDRYNQLLFTPMKVCSNDCEIRIRFNPELQGQSHRAFSRGSERLVVDGVDTLYPSMNVLFTAVPINTGPRITSLFEVIIALLQKAEQAGIYNDECIGAVPRLVLALSSLNVNSSNEAELQLVTKKLNGVLDQFQSEKQTLEKVVQENGQLRKQLQLITGV